jgi:hypothetical protein
MLSCWLEGDCAAAGGSLDKDGERLQIKAVLAEEK